MFVYCHDGEDQGLTRFFGTSIPAAAAIPVVVAVAAATSSDSESWGFGVVQRIDAAALELFLGYRHFEYSDNALVYDDFDYVHAGARIKF